MVKKSLLCFLFVVVLFSSTVVAEDISLDLEGECKDFNVTLAARNFTDGIYDVKIGMSSQESSGWAGRIYDPKQGWKSSYYYVNDAFEVNNGTGSIELKVQSKSGGNVTLVGKLRKDGRTWESDPYEISQDCPEPEPLSRPVFLLIVLTAVLALLVGVTYYEKTGTDL